MQAALAAYPELALEAVSERTLFDRHAPELRERARRRLPVILRAKVGASDVVQDAWLAAFVSLGAFEDRGDGSFGAWLRRILEHKIADEVVRGRDAQKRDPRREVHLPMGTAEPGVMRRPPLAIVE